MTPRSLRRAATRASNRYAHAQLRCDEFPTAANHRLRVKLGQRALSLDYALQTIPAVTVESRWSLKPGVVVRVLREEHGIGTDLATRIKRKRRAVAAATYAYCEAQAYRNRVFCRTYTGMSTDAQLVKADEAVAHARGVLDLAEALRVGVLP